MSNNRRRTYIYGGDNMMVPKYIREGDKIYDIGTGTSFYVSSIATNAKFEGYFPRIDCFRICTTSWSGNTNFNSNCDNWNIGDTVTGRNGYFLYSTTEGKVADLPCQCYHNRGDYFYALFASSDSSTCNTYLYEITVTGKIQKILNLGLTYYTYSYPNDGQLFRFDLADGSTEDGFGYLGMQGDYAIFHPRYNRDSSGYYPSNGVWIVNLDTFELSKYIMSTNISVSNLKTPYVAYSFDE